VEEAVTLKTATLISDFGAFLGAAPIAIGRRRRMYSSIFFILSVFKVPDLL
jgi:hypothetical protein